MSIVKAQNFTNDELRHLREAGQILAGLFIDLRKQVHAGVTGKELNAWCAKEIKARGAHATYLTPEVNFPGVICISPNDVVVHGVPKDEPFEKGDLVGFDLVIDVSGMKADSAFTMCVDEEPTGAKKLLLNATERSLYAGIDAIHGATKLGDIGAAIEEVLEKAKLGIIRQLVGHGVGRSMHEAPDIPNYGRRGSGALVPIGNAIALEPMATLGGWKITQDDPDGWSIRTRDGSLAAHFEHTVLITENGAEIITKPLV
jgi:methionyl aminopeptidase